MQEQSKGIIKSTRVLPQSQLKKVHLAIIKSSKLCPSDDLQKEVLQNSIMGGNTRRPSIGENCLPQQIGSQKGQKKSCFQSKSQKRIAGGEQQIKSSKSIKFDFKKNDVFVYEQQPKSKKKKNQTKKGSQKRIPAPTEDGDICCKLV